MKPIDEATFFSRKACAIIEAHTHTHDRSLRSLRPASFDQPLIARLATPDACGERRLIGPLGPITAEQATLAVAKAAATRLAPFKEAKQLLERTGRCPLAVGVVGSTLKQVRQSVLYIYVYVYILWNIHSINNT